MLYTILIKVIIAVLLSYFAVVFFMKKALRKRSIIIVTSFWILAIIISFKYLDDQQFRVFLNAKFNQVSVHKDLDDNGSPDLPLPKNTAFAYRYSQKGSAYFTTQSNDKIIAFFKGISNKDDFSKKYNVEDGKTELNLVYKDQVYRVQIKKVNKINGYYLYVDSN